MGIIKIATFLRRLLKGKWFILYTEEPSGWAAVIFRSDYIWKSEKCR